MTFSAFHPLSQTAKNYYPSSFVFPVSPVVDIFGKTYDIWQRILPKFSPVVKKQDATTYFSWWLNSLCEQLQ
jgi:hypothetical protein